MLIEEKKGSTSVSRMRYRAGSDRYFVDFQTRKPDKSFERNRLFERRISVKFRHRLVNNSPRDDVNFFPHKSVSKNRHARELPRNRKIDNLTHAFLEYATLQERIRVVACTYELHRDTVRFPSSCSRVSRIISISISLSTLAVKSPGGQR
jgi:hypothetical protein